MPRIPLLIVSTLLLIGPGCITNPPETSDPDPFADNDQAALSAFERIKSRGETLPDSERYRMLFNRPPFDDTASPILSRLSQGRYPVADAGSNPRWQKAESCARCHEKEFEPGRRVFTVRPSRMLDSIMPSSSNRWPGV